MFGSAAPAPELPEGIGWVADSGRVEADGSECADLEDRKSNTKVTGAVAPGRS
jgi:hypothetical protein